MANIRTFSDERDRENARPLNRDVNSLGSNLLVRGDSDPSKESFTRMLHLNLCPQLTLISLSVFLSIGLSIIFFGQVAVCGINGTGQFLEPQRTSFTQGLSASYASVVEKRQIWKLLTFWLIHPDLPKLVSSVIMFLIWGSYIEGFFGLWRTFVLFFLTTVCGAAFGILFAQPGDILMGASVGLFGLLGASLGFIIFNWNNIPESRFPKLFMFWMIVFIIIFSLLMNNSASTLLLELGGIFSGIFAGLFLSPKYTAEAGGPAAYSPHEKVVTLIGSSLYGFMLTLSLFFIWILKKRTAL